MIINCANHNLEKDLLCYNRDMKPLCDFPAEIVRIKTMADLSIRLELSLPETETKILSRAHELIRRSHYLRIVIYDEDEFKSAIMDRK